MSRRKWMVAAGLLALLTAGRLFFPEIAGAWRSELRKLLSDTADTLGFAEALGRSLRSADGTGKEIEVFYPAADVIEDQTNLLPSYPPL